MLFKRRKAASLLETLRVWIWPRRSWLRSTQYVTKRILRITATPHSIAAGVAAGVFTSFTPFMGLHFLFAFALAWALRGSLIASALGTFFGNPLTFPIIWTATFNTGNYLLGNHGMAHEALGIGHTMKRLFNATLDLNFHAVGQGLSDIWFPLLYPMTIGGALLGPLFAIPAYFLTKRGTQLFRERRRNAVMKRAEAVRERARKLAAEAQAKQKGRTV
ncbi:DUF2062 domain-containing protein [Pseudahrensia aquimaris]|uniref:DUF2062 domain-containing protein n=1 Tax=Pseudahrensia aquimaris TaxID=744461 RepID=A0ABW3FDA4_9HYPH